MRLEQRDDVAVLQLDDAENRFHPRFVSDFDGALDELAASGAAALVVTGEGKFFSNGLDLDWLLGETDADVRRQFFADLFRQWARLLTMPVVTVAAVNGHAFAAGAMLSLCCDIRVMRADRGFWCLPEADLGMPLQPAMAALITAKLPQPVLHESVVLGLRYGGTDAQAAGIVHEVVSEDEVLTRSVAMAAGHAAKAGDSQRLLKAGLYPDAVRLLEDPAAGITF